MKKSSLLTALLITFSSSAFSAPSSYGPIGSNIGYGDSSNPNTIYDPLSNPANNALNVTDEGGWRFGLGINLQSSAELKDLEGSVDYFDDNIIDLVESGNPANIPALENNIDEFKSKYDGGTLSAISGVTIPFLVKSDVLGGGITIDYTKQYGTKGLFIDGPNPANAIVSGSNLSIDEGSSALALVYKELDEFAVSYGFNAYSGNSGTLSVGITGRYISILANQNNVDMKRLVDDNANGTTDINDYVEDMDKGSSDSNFTADIGINWVATNYAIGVVGMNLTEPTFDVNDVTDSGYGFFTTSEYLEDKYKMKAQYRVTGQIYTDNRRWTLGASYDLVEANNLNNDDTQWWTASASWASNSHWYIPDVRFGLRGNQVGNKFTYGTFGMNFGVLAIDFAATTLNVKDVADKQKDAGLMASAGLEFDF